jgi:chorismate mutase
MAKLADPFYSDSVKSNREDIDKCDGQLLNYLQSRVLFAATLAKTKHRLGLPIEDPEREAQVRKNAVSFIKKHGCGLITKDEISEYIDIVIKITKRAEEREIAEMEKENESSRTAQTH